MEKILNLEKINQLLYKYWFLLIVIFSLPSVWALFVPGFYGASDDLHIAWLFEMDKTLKLGQIPPRFVPDLSFGFGYPLFNFVFPLPFYIGEVFHLLSLNFVDSVKAVFLISLIFSAIFMYLLLREFTSEVLSFVGALIYLYTPYRSNDVYNRGALGESLAFVFLPLFSLSIVKVAKKNSLKWVSIGGLSLTALILSHNITTYMFFPFALFLSLIFIFSYKNKLKSLIYGFLLIMLGLFCGVYFWLPALVDSSLVKYDTVFNFVDHFPTLGQLIKPGWSYGASVAGPYDGMSFFLGVVNWVLVIVGVALYIAFWRKYSKSQKIILGWSILSFGLSLLMMNYRSIFLWQHLPLLPYFQFPWRFLIITTLVVPILIITLEKIKYGYLISLGLLGLAILLNLNVFRPHDFLGRLDEYYLKRYIPAPVASKEYFEIQEEYLRLPVNTSIRPNKNYSALNVLVGNIEDQKIINDLSISFKTSTSGAVVDYNKYNFPGWYAYIDDNPLGIKNGEPFSQIRVEVPKGDHLVKIEFKETALKRVLDITSMLAIITAIALIFLPKSQLKKLINVISNLNE